MNIHLENVGKKYYTDWIIKNFSYQFHAGQIIGIKGINGSGKSTLLKLISSILTPTEGKINYIVNQEEIPVEEIRYKISFIAPYTTLLPQFTIKEVIDFHFSFKKLQSKFTTANLLEDSWLINSKNLMIKELSSGMKQRLKLALAFYSTDEMILLDEPTSNLDKKGIAWVDELIQDNKGKRMMIIASNEERDFRHCDNVIDVKNYKA